MQTEFETMLLTLVQTASYASYVAFGLMIAGFFVSLPRWVGKAIVGTLVAVIVVDILAFIVLRQMSALTYALMAGILLYLSLGPRRIR